MSDPTLLRSEARTVSLWLPKRLWRGLRSVRLAIVLMALIAVACIVGTIIKQEPYDAATVVGKYGRRLGSLVGLLGLNQLYHTGWFISLLGLFALSTVACALSRFRLSTRSIGFTAVHLSIVFIVAGAMVKGVVGIEGVVAIEEGHTVDGFEADGGKVPLGFRLRLDDFIVQRYENAAGGDVLLVHFKGEEKAQSIPIEVGKVAKLGKDGLSLEVLQRLPHFMKDGDRVYSASDRPVNPAVQVRVLSPTGESTRWLFAKFPDFHGHDAKNNDFVLRYVQRPAPVKAYESRVAVLDEQDNVLQEATVLVNSPFKAGRYTLYQLSYDPNTERSSTLEVVHDPGVPLVFIGFVLMPLGMVFVFYIQPLLARRKRADV